MSIQKPLVVKMIYFVSLCKYQVFVTRCGESLPRLYNIKLKLTHHVNLYSRRFPDLDSSASGNQSHMICGETEMSFGTTLVL